MIRPLDLKQVFISRGVAEPGLIELADISFSWKHILVFRYDVHDLPNCENIGFLYPWRHGYRQ